MAVVAEVVAVIGMGALGRAAADVVGVAAGRRSDLVCPDDPQDADHHRPPYFTRIAFSGASANITESCVLKWIELVVALIFSKLILVDIFLIGLSMVQGAGSTRSASN